MKRTLSRKIFIYMLVFSLLIIGVIGIGTRFVLPTYYLQKQLSILNDSEAVIREAYEDDDIETAISQMELLEETLGGDLYYYNEMIGSQGYGMGKGGSRMMNANAEVFLPDGDVTVYQYTNKIDLDIHVMGLLMDDSYLVYEVNIQTLNQAASAMMDFILVLLALVLFMAILVSLVLSRTISKPIRQLNALAKSMKTNQVEPYMVTNEVNEIHQLNQTLNELYESLQGKIYQLGTELNKERNAEKLKKRFLAQATHELKTPISVIRGYAEILYDGMYKDEEDRDRYLQNIYEETEAVSHLILDVLDYTKMETGNYKLNLQQVIVAPYLNQLFERYRDFVESMNLDFVLEIEVPETFTKMMDSDRFEQVYKNLLSNAVEHAQSTVITKVRVIGDKLRLSVYNDGQQIEEEDLPNVFESFYKKKGKRKGTGLGLAIVKEIVLLHQGEYRVENRPEGVSFIIIL